MTTQRAAPKFLNLLRIQFPVGAVTSIGHRISGVLLFVSLPLFVYLLDISLLNPEGYEKAAAILDNCWVRAGSVVIAWSMFHHLFSGIRFLLIDIEAGVSLKTARSSAWFINIAAVLLALAYAGWVL